jgi:hypothetical protein
MVRVVAQNCVQLPSVLRAAAAMSVCLMNMLLTGRYQADCHRDGRHRVLHSGKAVSIRSCG